MSPGDFQRLYDEGYFKGGEYADYEREAPALRANFRRRLRELRARHPDGGALWEIGCAYGYFLELAGEHFRAAGCDVSEAAVQSAVRDRGVDARRLDYLEYEPAAALDVVCLWDTIEHLPNPDAILAKAHRDLRDGGTLALSTGDIGSLNARLRGARWRQIHPPTHVHYFTRHSMTTLLTRLGFQDITVRYFAFWRNMRTVAEKLAGDEAPRPARRAREALGRLGVLDFNFPLNLYDLMTVYARKQAAHSVVADKIRANS